MEKKSNGRSEIFCCSSNLSTNFCERADKIGGTFVGMLLDSRKIFLVAFLWIFLWSCTRAGTLVIWATSTIFKAQTSDLWGPTGQFGSCKTFDWKRREDRCEQPGRLDRPRMGTRARWQRHRESAEGRLSQRAMAGQHLWVFTVGRWKLKIFLFRFLICFSFSLSLSVLYIVP